MVGAKQGCADGSLRALTSLASGSELEGVLVGIHITRAAEASCVTVQAPRYVFSMF